MGPWPPVRGGIDQSNGPKLTAMLLPFTRRSCGPCFLNRSYCN
jgi:hypothetical protein